MNRFVFPTKFCQIFVHKFSSSYLCEFVFVRVYVFVGFLYMRKYHCKSSNLQISKLFKVFNGMEIYVCIRQREMVRKKSITSKNVILNNLDMLTKNTVNFIKNSVCIGLILFFENNSAMNK